MASFDQRGQIVGTQINSGGDALFDRRGEVVGAQFNSAQEAERFERWLQKNGDILYSDVRLVAWYAWQAALKDR